MAEDPKSGPRVKVMKNGPCLVTGKVPLREERIRYGADGEPERWEQGPPYPEKEVYSLCRCGLSKAKPYCDGSHFEAGFDGTETASRDPYLAHVERTEGPRIDLTWSEDLCMQACFCHAGRGAWDYAEDSDDPESRRRAVEEAGNCPSGSLVAWDKETGAAIEPPDGPEIGLVEDPAAGQAGPLWVRGGVPVESADGFVHEKRNRVTLCRCGRSGKKPFCDGAHRAAGFRSKP
jgi:CDGSH-type Zn-finger protein